MFEKTYLAVKRVFQKRVFISPGRNDANLELAKLHLKLKFIQFRQLSDIKG